MVKFRLREEKLKKKWSGKNDMVPVNAPQFLYTSEKKEEGFLDISQRNNQCQENSMKIN